MMKLATLNAAARPAATGALLWALLAVGAVALPASAAINVDINIGVPPPHVRYEAVPQARSGYIWAPGFWVWDGGHHQWHDGRWVAQRSGYRYTPERWEQRGDRYHYRAARWDQDSRPSKSKKHYSNHGHDHDRGDDHDQRNHARREANRRSDR
jgi:hypothetical protein